MIFKLDDAAAIDAEKMVVGWLIEEIWIVGGLIIAEIDFPQQVCLHQQAESAVNSGTGSFRVQFPCAIKELICRKMLIFGKRSFYDDFTLHGPAQAFAPDELIESFLNTGNHSVFVSLEIRLGKRKR